MVAEKGKIWQNLIRMEQKLLQLDWFKFRTGQVKTKRTAAGLSKQNPHLVIIRNTVVDFLVNSS
jgi:hypothetical protein